MNKCIVEMIGTFFLVFTVGVTVLTSEPLAPFAIAGVLMVMIYAGGHISGAHYNPAVTFGVMLRGKIDKEEAVAYVIVQLIAAVAAAICAGLLVGSGSQLLETGTVVQLVGFKAVCAAFVAELLFAFALTFVILNVATASGTANNSFYGVAIAGTVLAGALTVGWITGGAFNPAVTLGGLLLRIFPWTYCWVYFLAQFLGAGLAAKAFLAVNPEE
ncbi:MAG: aquaporin [Planctomycetota bacterium]